MKSYTHHTSSEKTSLAGIVLVNNILTVLHFNEIKFWKLTKLTTIFSVTQIPCCLKTLPNLALSSQELLDLMPLTGAEVIMLIISYIILFRISYNFSVLRSNSMQIILKIIVKTMQEFSR